MISPRALHTARTALWITCGWIGAAVLVHWIVRRVPTHLAREFTATATGAVIGLGSAWFELRLIPRYVRALTVDRGGRRPRVAWRPEVAPGFAGVGMEVRW